MKTPKRGFMFNSIRVKKPKRNLFNLSYENKFSLNMGELCPFYVQDVLPNDTIKLNYDYLMRTQPMLAPLMHRVDVYQYFFFVPLRLIWTNFENFITGGESGDDVVEHPFFEIKDIMRNRPSVNKLFDLLGYPVDNPHGEIPSGQSASWADQKVSSLRWRAYNLIYNEYFRDQNLEDAIDVPLTDGKDTFTLANGIIQHRSWKKDYFTSALPSQQRGSAVVLPLGGSAPVTIDASKGHTKMTIPNSDIPASNMNILTDEDGKLVGNDGTSATIQPLDTNYPALSGTADLSQATSISINDFRIANVLQKFKELMNRGGSRYVEQIRSLFGIIPDDYRLQRPLYLGGNKQPLNISEVVQTSGTLPDDEEEPIGYTAQGNLAGRGTAFGSQFAFKHTFSEHGIIIGLMCVLPTASYQQGCSRLLQKFDRFDYANPMFANIGEQEVYNRELFMWTHKPASGDDKDLDEYNNGIFGYQSRFAEYKYNFDQVHGDFRDSLSYWHLGRLFGDEPNLNASFVQADVSKHIFAVESQDYDSLLCDVYNSSTALRCLSSYGTPAL